MSPPKLRINTSLNSEQTSKHLIPETPDANPGGLPVASPLSCPNSTQVRSWTKEDGKFLTEAQFLCVTVGNVKVLKMNGITIHIPFDDLCQADQLYIAKTSGKTLKSILKIVAPDQDDGEPKRKKRKLDGSIEDVFE